MLIVRVNNKELKTPNVIVYNKDSLKMPVVRLYNESF